MPELSSSFRASSLFSSPAKGIRKRRWLRLLVSVVGSLAALVVLVALAGALWLRSAAHAALAVLDGEVHVAGLSAPVTVRRDGHGVPHIDAATQEDLFAAQGYVTAQDRLWQMDSLRRNANGELAEVMGPSLVKHDKAQRVLQFRVTAERIYAGLPAEERTRFDAYARGVNLFIEQSEKHGSLPTEFKLLHYQPRPWKGADSIGIGLTMVQMLDTHWPAKLARERIAADLHNERLESDLYPVGSWRDHPPTGIQLDLSQPHPEPPATPDSEDDEDERTETLNTPMRNHPHALPAGQEDPAALRAAMGLPTCDGCAPGSNNWVVSGAHTASGKPLLSNDMHLGLYEPNIWFMADLKAPGFHAAGVTLPGMPFVIAGHNEHVAWGFTALFADVQDLYVEKLDGNGHYQDASGAWKPLAVDRETIKVRGASDVVVEVQSTAHGPLLNPMFAKESRPIALRWTLYDPALTALPVYQMNVAENWTEFSAALGAWCWPTQNVVYSDDQGHIAYHAVGRVPQRPNGIPGVPVQDAGHEWQGYIPFDAMPNAFDPPAGLLATANARVSSEKFPTPLTKEWAEPYRAERIYKVLQGRDGLKPADMLALQNDIYSDVDQEMGHRLAYAIDHASNTDDRLRKAADLMRVWDGRLTTDSAAASVVESASQELPGLILEPRLGKDAAEYEWGEANFAMEEIVMHANPDWLPKQYKSWDELLTEAVRRGMAHHKAPGDVAQWTYGSWHVVDIEHPLNGLLPLLSRIAGTGAQPLSGDGTTVKQVGRAFGPSQRFTMDWSNVDGSTENIVLGESGDPYSPYFRDQWKDYYAGTTFALPFTPAAVAAETRHTLRLIP